MFSFLKNISSTEIIVIALIILVLFGSKILMKLAKTSGETMREIKKAKKGLSESLDDSNSSTN